MPKHIKSFLELRFLASLTFSSYNSMCFLTRFLTHLLFSQKFVFEILLFNFQGSMPARLFLATALLLYHTLFRLSTPFFHFFEVFSVFFRFLLKLTTKARKGKAKAVKKRKRCDAETIFELLYKGMAQEKLLPPWGQDAN